MGPSQHLRLEVGATKVSGKLAEIIELSDEIAWPAVNWIHNKAVEDIAGELQASLPVLAASLLESHTEINGGFADLMETTPEELSAVRDAVNRLLDRYELEGLGVFAMPEAQPAFVREMRDLCDKID